MELAIHLRNIKQMDGPLNLSGSLVSFYEWTTPRMDRWEKAFARSYNRIYVGDEFCSNRLPTLPELQALLEFASANKMGVTFLTPPLAHSGFDTCSALLECLREGHPTAEVVFNDWGVLLFLKERYPEFSLAAGRLLDKGFKDPRLPGAAALSSLSAEADALLDASSFDSAGVREKLIELGVARLERDMFPYRQSPPENDSKFHISIHFPFGYVTTGRVCWTATFDENATERFAPLSECSRPCNSMTMKLKSADASLSLTQSGNTVYYLYSTATLNSIIAAARRGKCRLVYQGFAM